jgi:hypothetical protein
MKHPTGSDFEVKPSKTAVEVIFKRTGSRYTFKRFFHHRDFAEFGPLSRKPHIQHVDAIDKNLAARVRAMAFRLASEAAKGGRTLHDDVDGVEPSSGPPGRRAHQPASRGPLTM